AARVATRAGLRQRRLSLQHQGPMSNLVTDDVRARAPATWRPSPGLRRREAPTDDAVELGFRFAAVQVGYWLGWASIAIVLTGLAFDGAAHHRPLLVAA